MVAGGGGFRFVVPVCLEHALATLEILDVVALWLLLTFHSSFQVSSLTVVIVFIIARLWGTRAMRRRQFYSANGFVSENRATMGYPRDAPATVLFGEWFRFGKPSDQQFIFERTIYSNLEN
ncbi:hypothetical protein LXL04_034011 [Taraxacum kok-saghyz]